MVRDHGNGFDVDGVLDQDAPTGVGILSVRERIEAIGGSLVIDSSPGTGSVFTVYLPHEATQAQGLLTRDTPPERVGPNGRKTAVIVVDDHTVIRQGLVMLLNEEPDLEVVGEAENGARAIELARQLCPDVIVMDLSMPGVPGDEATAAIREEVPRVRVIGLSMHAEEEARARMLSAGADAYLPKAGPSSELIAAIRRAARRTT
jgi:CheY-like chemotaxis protein